jgi:hypothetical protein
MSDLSTAQKNAISTLLASANLDQSLALGETLQTLIDQIAAGRRTVAIRQGTISATTAIPIPLPALAGRIVRVAIVATTTVAAHDTNYWTFGVVNKGAAGDGTAAAVDAAAAANSSKATGGSAVTAHAQRALTLSVTPADLAVSAGGDTLLLTATKAASGADLVNLTVLVEIEL